MSKKNHKDPSSVPFHQELIDQENFLVVQLMRIVSRQLKTDPDTKIFGDGSLPVEVDLSEIHKPFLSTQAIDAAFQRLVVRGIVVFFDDSFSGPVGGRIIEIYKEKLEKAFQKLPQPTSERFSDNIYSESMSSRVLDENESDQASSSLNARNKISNVLGADIFYDDARQWIKFVRFHRGVLSYETSNGSSGKISFVSSGMVTQLTKQGKLVNHLWKFGKRCYRGELEDPEELESRGEIISLSNLMKASESKSEEATIKIIQDIAIKFKVKRLKMGPRRVGSGYVFVIYKGK